MVKSMVRARKDESTGGDLRFPGLFHVATKTGTQLLVVVKWAAAAAVHQPPPPCQIMERKEQD